MKDAADAHAVVTSEHDTSSRRAVSLTERFFLEPLLGHVEVPHHAVDALHEPG
jgi:hypothetical protein